MKIVYLTQLFYPIVYGGGEYEFYLWAKYFAKLGHDVHVITQKVLGAPDFEIIDGIKVHRVGKAIKYEGRLAVGALENLSYLYGAIKRGLSLSKDANVIHANTYTPAIAGSFIHKFSGKPYIVTIHDVYFAGRKDFWNSWSKQESMSKTNSILGPLIEKIVVKLPSTLIHTVSDASKSDIVNLGAKPEKIRIVPNGINLGDFKSKSIKEKQQIIFVGRLVFYKNLEVVISALANIKKVYPKIKLLIVGDGPHRKALEKLTADLNLKEDVIFKGRVSHAEKVILLHESLLAVQPSTVEGFGISIIEAFACGKPVVVSDVPPLSELVANGVNGYTAHPHKEEEWSRNILALIKNKSFAEKIGERNLADARKYSIEHTAKFMLEIYSSLFGK